MAAVAMCAAKAPMGRPRKLTRPSSGSRWLRRSTGAEDRTGRIFSSCTRMAHGDRHQRTPFIPRCRAKPPCLRRRACLGWPWIMLSVRTHFIGNLNGRKHRSLMHRTARTNRTVEATRFCHSQQGVCHAGLFRTSSDRLAVLISGACTGTPRQNRVHCRRTPHRRTHELLAGSARWHRACRATPASECQWSSTV